jgi:hypothetical protein
VLGREPPSGAHAFEEHAFITSSRAQGNTIGGLQIGAETRGSHRSRSTHYRAAEQGWKHEGACKKVRKEGSVHPTRRGPGTGPGPPARMLEHMPLRVCLPACVRVKMIQGSNRARCPSDNPYGGAHGEDATHGAELNHALGQEKGAKTRGIVHPTRPGKLTRMLGCMPVMKGATT